MTLSACEIERGSYRERQSNRELMLPIKGSAQPLGEAHRNYYSAVVSKPAQRALICKND